MDNIVVKVYRDRVVESKHRVSVAVVDASGKLIESVGNPNMETCLRSSAKPFQIIPMLEAGCVQAFHLSLPEVAIVIGSHNSEDIHVATVKSILDKIGLGESDLRCGIHEPLRKQTAAELREAGVKLTQLHNNCSGKHAGMLAACVKLGFPTEEYLEHDHPLQQMIDEVVREMTDCSEGDLTVGIDNCGVPVFGMPLKKMAQGYARLMDLASRTRSSHVEAVRVVVSAMTTYPEMIAGSDRLCTDLMQVAGDRVVGKIGAEGLYCLGLRNEKVGIALKIEDGAWRATAPAILFVLEQLGVLQDDELRKFVRYRRSIVKSHNGQVVGEIVAESETAEAA